MNLELIASIVHEEMLNRSFIATGPFSQICQKEIITPGFAGINNHDPCGANAKFQS